jgi:hypothetical protein
MRTPPRIAILALPDATACAAFFARMFRRAVRLTPALRYGVTSPLRRKWSGARAVDVTSRSTSISGTRCEAPG